MKKNVLDMIVIDNQVLSNNYFLLKLTPADSSQELPYAEAGQFVEIRVDKSPTTFLRRPISINFIDFENNELWLLIQKVGDGTKALSQLKVSDSLNIIYPLGNSFGLPDIQTSKLVLIGGGVGVAPMLYLGKVLFEKGFTPDFLLGFRSSDDIVLLEEFRKYGNVHITTEDGSYGEKGYVTNHTVLQQPIQKIFTCGPKPMMMAVAKFAKPNSIECEVSLENTMACGFGVCLCCVEKTTEGHVCVCSDGPIFNIDKLTWQI
ncbi:MAG: dihydroorotate dehydrogenase electron transfer subunit [Bacteroidales bacterium]